MPTPTIPDGELFMNATLWTGNGGTQTINNGAPGQSFQPDLFWGKSRSLAYSNNLTDSVRGAGFELLSNDTSAQQNNGGVTSFNSNGVTLSSWGGYNQSGATYVAWQWKAGGAAVTNTAGSISAQVSANTTSGFSIVTYTGNGTSGATIGHGIGVAPKMIFVKQRNSAVDWRTYTVGAGNTGGLILNKNIAFVTDSSYWNNTTPGSSVFTVGDNAYVNGSGGTYVAYCWSEIAGFSKFGSYTGNGSADGPFVYTGFRPRFVLIKRTDAVNDWEINDSSRNPSNVANLALYPNLANAETSTFALKDLLSNGFKIRTTDGNSNTNGGTYIYAAFAENPFKYANAR
jgi:hypothetical protein